MHERQTVERLTDEVAWRSFNAIADAVAGLMEHEATGDAGDPRQGMEGLRVAAGLERRM